MTTPPKVRVFLETTQHKAWVFWYLLLACWTLMRRAWRHDWSKYSREESSHFEKATPLTDLSYGSPEYYQELDKIQPALKHHYAANSHHPQHYKVGIYGMSPLDQIEMLCDWKAAGRRHKGGDIRKSIETNQRRFGDTNAFRQGLIRDAKEIGLLLE